MTTLDDKLLGEKLHYYCSSSEDEDGGADDKDADSEHETVFAAAEDTPAPQSAGLTPETQWMGSSKNTGPKGVIRDWQRYKQMQAEQRAADDMERLQLAKKLSLTCRTTGDDERERVASEQLQSELQHLMDDEQLLQHFVHQRLAQMTTEHASTRRWFGSVVNLTTADEFLTAIDDEDKSTTVIVHIYSDKVLSCRVLNEALDHLTVQYRDVKFCRIRCNTVGLSRHFSMKGLPALLVYKNGAVIGNFVRLEDELCDEFSANDVENFLIEHGILEDKSCVPSLIRDKLTAARQTNMH